MTDKRKRTKITDIEHIELIRRSTRDNVLECSFGIGWIALLPTKQNEWAFKALDEMRRHD